MKTVRLKLSGMHCPSCAMNVDGALEEIEGVKEARTSYAKAETVLTVDETAVDMEKVKREVVNLGYGVH